jgi:hypothetical protein
VNHYFKKYNYEQPQQYISRSIKRTVTGVSMISANKQKTIAKEIANQNMMITN